MSSTEDLIDDWLAALPSTTSAAYRRDLDQYRDWLSETPVLEVGRALAQRWVNHLRDGDLADSSVRRKRSAASSFYHYAVSVDALASNPFTHVRVPKGGAAVKTGLSMDKTRALLAQARRDGPIRHAFIMLLVTTGVRISGACGAHVTDLGDDREHHTLEITLKGGATKTLPLAPHTHTALLTAIGDRHKGPIFLTSHGTALKRSTGGHWVTQTAQRAGIGHVTPHLLRHTAASLAIADGADLVHVQRLLGHRSVQTTMNYLQAIDALDNSPAYRLDEFLNDEEE